MNKLLDYVGGAAVLIAISTPPIAIIAVLWGCPFDLAVPIAGKVIACCIIAAAYVALLEALGFKK